MTEDNRKALKDYRSQAVRAAKDFGYGKEVVKKIRDAETEEEIITIMTRARKERD